MTDELKAEREAFVKWARYHGYSTYFFGDHVYHSRITRSAWEAWQARAKLDRSPKPINEDDYVDIPSTL